MRPVEKLEPGDYNRAECSYIRIQDTYAHYRDAKEALIFNMGLYCSYCEDAYHQPRDLNVEHVRPKSRHPQLENRWDNLLLSCPTCNGADNKGDTDLTPGECHLPHLNNTYKSLTYKAGGVVEVNPCLNDEAKQHAQGLLSLVGLDKSPATSSPGDKRWKKRKDDWDLACRYRSLYEANKNLKGVIIDLVKARGGWSIWFTVFKGHDEIRRLLIDSFPGTAASCFDADNHYEPVDRNPEREGDKT